MAVSSMAPASAAGSGPDPHAENADSEREGDPAKAAEDASAEKASAEAGKDAKDEDAKKPRESEAPAEAGEDAKANKKAAEVPSDDTQSFQDFDEELLDALSEEIAGDSKPAGGGAANAVADAAAEALQALPPPAGELKRCSVCLADLPLRSFPRDGKGKIKGATCTEDSDAAESLQRMLRVGWSTTCYRDRYTAFKKNKPVWRQVVLAHRMDNSANGRTKRKAVAAVKARPQFRVLAIALGSPRAKGRGQGRESGEGARGGSSGRELGEGTRGGSSGGLRTRGIEKRGRRKKARAETGREGGAKGGSEWRERGKGVRPRSEERGRGKGARRGSEWRERGGSEERQSGSLGREPKDRPLRVLLPATRDCRVLALGPEPAEVLRQLKYKRKELTKRNIVKPMTWPVFQKFRESDEGGGYQQEQIKAAWKALQDDEKVEKDREGVVGGVTGALRIWVNAGSEKLDDTVEGEERLKESKAKAGCTGKGADDVEDAEAAVARGARGAAEERGREQERGASREREKPQGEGAKGEGAREKCGQGARVRERSKH